MFVDRHAVETEQDEVRLERGIERALTARPPARALAIFRVVTADAGFAFTRTVAEGDRRSVESFGPYGTQRAAHELAQRAAARFRAERPGFIVGVVDIEPVALPAAGGRFVAEAVEEPYAARPGSSCITCGKGLGLLRSSRQIYCARKPDQSESSCAVAGREKRRAKREQDPIYKAAQLASYRDRYIQRVATSEGRERERQKSRRSYRRSASLKVINEKTVSAPEVAGTSPVCIVCGTTTRFYQGRPVKFCPKISGEKYSKCQMRFANKRREERDKLDINRRRKRVEQQRAYLDRNPDLKRAKMLRDRERVRNNPSRYAAKLERERLRKARQRAEQQALRKPDAPTGSVLLTASPRTPGHALLTRIYAAVPSNIPPGLRMEIIGETAALVLEGVEMATAVAQASKSIRRDENRLRYAKPIDDCFWLADDTALNWEAAL